MCAHVAADHARIEVIGAADAVADIFVDIAVLIKVRRALRECETHGSKHQKHGNDGADKTVASKSVVSKSVVSMMTHDLPRITFLPSCHADPAPTRQCA